MPFQSKRQWRAAFAGQIPGFSKEKAREWAHETKTEFKDLPDRAPAEKGKPTLRSKKASSSTSKAVYVAKKLREQLMSSGTGKNVFDAIQNERERLRRKQAADEFVDFCVKIAFAVPRPGQVSMAARHVGSFRGRATTNFLKAPGSTTAAVTNPRLSLRNAMTKTMRA
jgi:hypothetical protein